MLKEQLGLKLARAVKKEQLGLVEQLGLARAVKEWQLGLAEQMKIARELKKWQLSSWGLWSR